MSAKTQATNRAAANAAKPSPRLTVRGITNLGKIKVDPVLSAILTKVDGNIQLKIDQDNSNIGLFSNKSDKRLGSIAELERLNGFRKFIADSRKATTTQEIMDPVREIIFRVLKENSDITEPTKIMPGALNNLKEIKLQFDFLEENLDFNEETLRRLASDTTKIDVCDIINFWIAEIVKSMNEVIKAIVSGKDPKGLLLESLYKKGVPKWAYDKLAKSDLATIGHVDAELILFPRDPRKGLQFTVKEITDDDFIKQRINAFLLQNSQYQIAVLKNSELLKTITKSKEAVSLASESDAIGTQLRSEKIIISPIRYNAEVLLDDKATKFNLVANASFATPKQALQAVLMAGLAYQTGLFKTNDAVEDYWKKLFPAIDFSSDVNRKKSVQSLVKESGDLEPLKGAFEFVGDHKEIFNNIVPVFLGLSATSEIITVVKSVYDSFRKAPCAVAAQAAAAAVYDANGEIVTPAKVAIRAVAGWNRPKSSKLSWEKIRPDFAIETGEDQRLAKIAWKKAGVDDLSLAKRHKVNKIVHMSELTKTGRLLVKDLEDNPRISFLAAPVKDWLCGFSTREIQVVGAMFVKAQFHELTGLEGGEDDDDPGETENEEIDDEDDDL